MSVSKFSFYWDVQNSDKFTGTPVRQKIRNDLDAHGSFLDLPRLPAESNFSYYKRLQSVLPLRAGSDHNGLVHGITRELDLEEFVGLIISPVQSGGRWLAPSPYAEITSTEVILYSSYINSTENTVDMRIDIFDHGSGYLLEDLVAQIQTSEYFVAELGSDMTGAEKSNGLFPGSSAVVVPQEWVPASTYFTLEHGDIIPGSLYFTEKEILTTELSTAFAANLSDPDPNRPLVLSGFSGQIYNIDPEAEGLSLTWSITTPVTRDGEYFVDYDTGIVTSKTSASGRGTCRYAYRQFPWYVRWSPVVVYSLRDEVYRDKVFEGESMPDNSTKQGLVTSEGVDVYTQVFGKSPCLWGE